jgi:hypothetical protein
MNMRPITTTVLALAAILAMAASAQAATPQRSAKVTGACLRDRGWTVTVRGRTVRARSPRVRPAGSYPRRPELRVTFSTPPFPPVEVRWALNDREGRTATRCVNRGLGR